MSASMAEVLSLHNAVEGGADSGYCAAPDCWWFYEPNGDLPELIAAHQASVLAADGYGKLEDAWDMASEHAREIGLFYDAEHKALKDANIYRNRP